MKNINYFGQAIRFILVAFFVFNYSSCKKEKNPTPPVLATLTTNDVTDITENSAVCGGIITKNGYADITARGVCWNTTGNPTVNDQKTNDGIGIGSFTSNLTNLQPNTPYFVKAYAVNQAGVAYGYEKNFETPGTGGVPHVITVNAKNVTANSADLGGKVTEAGGSAVTERGVCWAVYNNPTINDNKQAAGSDTGSFVTTVTGLATGQNYFFRAYAINDEGTGYGSVEQFNTSQGSGQSCPGLPVLTDPRDGQQYPTVQIGSQCWMAKNLNIGEIIELHQDQDPTKYQKWCFGNVSGNCDTYGGLYQWEELMQGATQQGSRGICPEGWHVPTDGEWITMIMYLGGYDPSGGKIKEAGFDHWQPPNTSADNSSGFTALPGGMRYTIDSLTYDLGYLAYFWTSNINWDNTAWCYWFFHNQGNAYRYALFHHDGASVRCLKNE